MCVRVQVCASSLLQFAVMSAIIGTVANVASLAIGIGTNPITLAGLLPLFAIGLTYMRYKSFDPESYPIDAQHVSSFFFANRTRAEFFLWLDISRI